jgi:hypothetical protein
MGCFIRSEVVARYRTDESTSATLANREVPSTGSGQALRTGLYGKVANVSALYGELFKEMIRLVVS